MSGQGPKDARGLITGHTVAEQTAVTLKNIERVVVASGASMRDLVRVTVHLANLEDFDEFDRTYRQIVPEPYPTRTTVGSQLRRMLVEIDAIAYMPPVDR